MQKTPKRQRRVTRFQVRFTGLEFAQLEAVAGKLGISKGAVLRRGAELLANEEQARKLASGE